MGSNRDLPSYERVRSVFDYNPISGILSKGGKAVGWLNRNGYLRCDLDGSKHYVHRIIFFWMTGCWPATVDHRDLNKRNNCWNNLRGCSKTDNQGNRTHRVDNASGVKGIHWDAERCRWVAQIQRDGKHHYIGRFSDLDAAKAAYLARAVSLYGEFARVA